MNRIASIATVLLVMALAACAHAPREGFGSSVRHMIGAQIHNPAMAQQPGNQPPPGLAGDKAAQAMKAYRSDKPLDAPGRNTLLLPVETAP